MEGIVMTETVGEQRVDSFFVVVVEGEVVEEELFADDA